MRQRAAQPSTSPLLTSHTLRHRSPVNYSRTRIIRNPPTLARPRGRPRKTSHPPLPTPSSPLEKRRGPGRPRGRGRRARDDDYEVDEEEDEEDEEGDEGEEEGEEEGDEKEDKVDWSEESHRRSGRTAGKKVDYTMNGIDQLIRDVALVGRSVVPHKKKSAAGRRREEERMEEEEEEETGEDEEMEVEEMEDGDEEQKAPLGRAMTDSEDEGWYGRKRTIDPEEQRWKNEAAKWDGLEVTKILGMRRVPDPITDPTLSTSPPLYEEYLVKWKGRGYKHCQWIDYRALLHFPAIHIKGLVSRFNKKHHNQSSSSPPPIEESDDGTDTQLEEGQYFDPLFTQVDRVIGRRGDSYLVKWKGLGYEEATWESAGDIDNDLEIARYYQYSQPPVNEKVKAGDRVVRSKYGIKKQVEELKFKGGRQLREYQVEGVSWMAFNYVHQQPSLLADEMGLGKTAQTIGLCWYLKEYCRMRGPFLIVAPLSTASHWQREFEAWTDFNCVIYHGTADAREIIEKYEFHSFERDGKVMKSPRSICRFNVLIVPDSIATRAINTLRRIDWRLLCVDEGHRLKNVQSDLAQALSTINANGKVILTGTPIQNNLTELWAVLHFLAPDTFPSESKFLSEYNDVTTGSTDALTRLQTQIEPYFLRRIKEDVEKNIPPRQETLIEVDLSRAQKVFYKMLYSQDLSVLMKGNKADLPSLLNLGVQLRKCCQHPWLLKGVEDTAVASAGLMQRKDADQRDILQLMVDSSGKFILLKKMLHKLKEEGHRVLIFSQMTRLLDLLEDAVRYWDFRYERIDGAITGNERQARIDRFMKPNSDRFLFLLSTKAGGLGLNLQSADTIIIFDSDWNPQNDLQAIARSHRIGQTKEVQVYRLIARNTYENEMFDRANKKLGLGHAIMGSMQSALEVKGVEGKASKEEIALMLRKGFYHQADDVESTQLTEDDIEKIMQRDAKVIEYRGQASEGVNGGGSNRFAKASFVTSAGKDEGEWNDVDFWKKMFPEHAGRGDGFMDENILVGKRKRKMLHGTYEELLQAQEGKRSKQLKRFEMMEDEFVSVEQSSSESEQEEEKEDVKKAISPTLIRPSPLPGDGGDLYQIFVDSLLKFGYGRWARIKQDMMEEVNTRLNKCQGEAMSTRQPQLQLVRGVVEALSDDDLMYYTVGWLKMLYVYRQHRLLYERVEAEVDSGEDEKRTRRAPASSLRLKAVRHRGGHTQLDGIDLHFSPHLAADARRVIVEERERKKAIMQEKAKTAAIASVNMLVDQAHAIQTAQQAPTSKDEKKEENKEAKKEANGGMSLDHQAKDEEEDEDEDDDLTDLHFFDLIERIPVHSSLLNKQTQSEFKRAGTGYLMQLQRAHQLQCFITEGEDGELTHGDTWFTTSDHTSSFKSTAQRQQTLEVDLGGWWKDPQDDWQLLKGMWIHGLESFSLISRSPHLNFASRLGKTVEVDTVNPFFKAQLDAVMKLEGEGKDGSPEHAKAMAAFQVTPQRVTTVLKVTWPDDGVMEKYSRKLLSSIKAHWKTQTKKAWKRKEEEAQREKERAAKAIQVKLDLERRAAAKETKRKADLALMQMVEREKAKVKEKKKEKREEKENRGKRDRNDRPSPPPLVPYPLPNLPLSPIHSTHPLVAPSTPTKQAHITSFFGQKPKLPLISTPTSSSRRNSVDQPRLSTSTRHSSSSPSSTSSSSSASHSLSSASPHPPRYQTLPQLTGAKKGTASMVTGWQLTLPRPSVEDEEEGDVDEEEDDLPPLVQPPKNAIRPVTPRAGARLELADDDDPVILISDSD